MASKVLKWKPRSPNIEVCESTINRTVEIAETLSVPLLALHYQEPLPPLSSLPTSCEASPGGPRSLSHHNNAEGDLP